jgi:hypothetical protein
MGGELNSQLMATHRYYSACRTSKYRLSEVSPLIEGVTCLWCLPPNCHLRRPGVRRDDEQNPETRACVRMTKSVTMPPRESVIELALRPRAAPNMMWLDRPVTLKFIPRPVKGNQPWPSKTSPISSRKH